MAQLAEQAFTMPATIVTSCLSQSSQSQFDPRGGWHKPGGSRAEIDGQSARIYRTQHAYIEHKTIHGTKTRVKCLAFVLCCLPDGSQKYIRHCTLRGINTHCTLHIAHCQTVFSTMHIAHVSVVEYLQFGRRLLFRPLANFRADREGPWRS